MDRDRVLPLRMPLGFWGAIAQRDADWERVKPLVEAISVFCDFHNDPLGVRIAISDIPLLLPRVKEALAQLDVEMKP